MLLRASDSAPADISFGAHAASNWRSTPVHFFQLSFCHCASVMTSGAWP
jgi:hypothetical protein